MKVINFTRKRALFEILENRKTLTVRPAFDVVKQDKSGDLPSGFTISQKARLVWRWHSDSYWYCRACGERAAIQDGKSTGHRNCLEQIPFNKYVGKAVISEIHRIKAGYWMKIPEPYFDFRDSQSHIWTENEIQETVRHRLPWFDAKYDIQKKAKAFWVIVLKDIQLG